VIEEKHVEITIAIIVQEGGLGRVEIVV